MAAILVTGGAGFIGSHLAIALRKGGHDVTVIDNMDPYYQVSIKHKNVALLRDAGCTFIEGSITDKKFVETIVEGMDFVYHEAAKPGVRASIKDPTLSYHVNAGGTLSLLEALRDTGIKRFINASSSSVYGKVAYLPFDEQHPTTPLSPYGVSKLVAEQYCRVYFEVYGLPTVSLRYFTVYGPRMRPDLAIPIFTKTMLRGERPTIYGNGEQTRDFTYVDDIIQGNIALLSSSSVDGQIINIGSGRRLTVNTLLETISSTLGRTVKPNYIDEMKGDAKHTLADISKAKQLIGYEPGTQLEDGVRRYIEWYGDGSFYGTSG